MVLIHRTIMSDLVTMAFQFQSTYAQLLRDSIAECLSPGNLANIAGLSEQLHHQADETARFFNHFPHAGTLGVSSTYRYGNIYNVRDEMVHHWLKYIPEFRTKAQILATRVVFVSSAT